MSIDEAVSLYKQGLLTSITNNGTSGSLSAIRSQKLILNLHEAVKTLFIDIGINPDKVKPIQGKRDELNVAGFFKRKTQDVCILPSIKKSEEILIGGLLDGAKDKLGKAYTARTIAVNIRSQASSLQKNFDTLYERTIFEAINLHERCPEMCLGEVYMIMVPEIDTKAAKENKLEFKKISQKVVEDYITGFQAINLRSGVKDAKYKYERVCLLIVDISKNPVKIYQSDEELKQSGVISNESSASISQMSWKTFAKDLIDIYNHRFNVS